jgi:hypothetical protein
VPSTQKSSLPPAPVKTVARLRGTLREPAKPIVVSTTQDWP